jgi:hypothetical protein
VAWPSWKTSIGPCRGLWLGSIPLCYGVVTPPFMASHSWRLWCSKHLKSLFLTCLMIRGIVGTVPGFLCAKEGGIASTAFGDSSATRLLLWGGSSRAYCGLRQLRLAQRGIVIVSTSMQLLVRSLVALSTTRQCSLRLYVNFTAIICHEDENKLFRGHGRRRPGVRGLCLICIQAVCSEQWVELRSCERCTQEGTVSVLHCNSASRKALA